MTSLTSRVHIFAQPNTRTRLADFFTDVLGCQALSLEVPGSPYPILVFTFANGASLSVEFTRDAPDERQVNRGAWLELAADDQERLKQKIGEAGLARVTYLGGEDFYFVAPGGQVMPIVSTGDVVG